MNVPNQLTTPSTYYLKQVVIVFANQTYQDRPNSMFECTGARDRGKPVVAIMLEPSPTVWISSELKSIVGIAPVGGRMFVDLCGFLQSNSTSPLTSLESLLNDKFRELMRLLQDLDCHPSMVPISTITDGALYSMPSIDVAIYLCIYTYLGW